MIFGSLNFLTGDKESVKLVELLGVGRGDAVAEIGAGDGQLCFFLAEVVGEEGVVYATEFEELKVENILKQKEQKKLSNLKVVRSGANSPSLPNIQFDHIIMKKVYHHFTNAAELNRSFFNLLKPGGKMAIVDFEPKWYLRFSTPKGIPQKYGGHGIYKKVLVEEVEASGFILRQMVHDWAVGGLYIALFEKPAS